MQTTRAYQLRLAGSPVLCESSGLELCGFASAQADRGERRRRRRRAVMRRAPSRRSSGDARAPQENADEESSAPGRPPSEFPNDPGDCPLSADSKTERRRQAGAFRARRREQQEYDSGSDAGGGDTRKHGTRRRQSFVSRDPGVHATRAALGRLEGRAGGESGDERAARTQAANAEGDEGGQAQPEPGLGWVRLRQSALDLQRDLPRRRALNQRFLRVLGRCPRGLSDQQ
jgi:hypothetical protein